MKILIAYDGSIHADSALEDLKWAGLPRNAQAIVLTATDWPMHAPRTWGMVDTGYGQEWTQRIAAAEQLAEAACNRIQTDFPEWDVQLETPTGDAATVILEKAHAWTPDLIVVGTHGRSGFKRALLGSVSLKLSREAGSSVRIARPRLHEGPIHLLIGNDGSPQSEAAVNEVCRRFWPAGTEARVVAVHEVLVPANSERIAIGESIYGKINEDEYFRLRNSAHEASEKLRHVGLVVSPVVEEGEPKEILVREARSWNADSLFVGARGLGGVERLLLGSVSSSVVTHAPCTVEVVRH